MTSGDLYNVLTGDGQSYNTKVSGWQADSQGNIEAFGAYHSASTSNGGQMPAQYAQINDSGAPISLATPGQDTQGKTTTGRTTTATDTGEWARNPGQTEVFGQDRDVQAGRNQNVYGQDVQSGRDQGQGSYQVPGQTPGSGAFDTTHANSYVPPAAAQGGGYQFGPTGQSLGNLGGGSGNQPYGGDGGFGPGTGGFGSGTGSGPGNVGGYRTGTGSGPGTGGYRTGGPNTGSPNTGGITQRGPGSGARIPEERLPGQAVARGAAGARGANGLPMGSPAGGRGAKDEDKEKKSAPYLKNPDPDETFGGFTEKPMPPVIGESRPKS